MALIRCKFCHKGPFPTQAGLNKHISLTKACHHASKKEFEKHAANIWHERTPASESTPNASSSALSSTATPERLSIEMEDMPNLDDNISFVGNERASGAPEIPTAPDVVFIEPFPEDAMAGAIWGKAMPKFQALWNEQKLGDSTWGPFDDEEDWQLAEWLLKNIGQKQTDAFLKLPIVCYSSINSQKL